MLSRQRFCSFGAPLHQDGLYCAFYEKANNSDNFCNFLLKKIHRKSGKEALVFADNNAGYHRSSDVRTEIKKFKGDVVLKYFPAYTPEPSPAEGQWRNTRIHTANRLYESADDMKKSIRTMMRTGEIAVAKMSHYLM